MFEYVQYIKKTPNVFYIILVSLTQNALKFNWMSVV